MFTVNEALDTLTLQQLSHEFGDSILEHEFSYDMMSITVKKEALFEIIRHLYDDHNLAFRFLTTLCGMHYPDNENALGVVMHLHSFTNNHRIRIKAFTRPEDPHFPSLTPLYPTANWMERETWDFFGIVFDGHPDLTRILNVDDFEGFPLRKDFPLEDQTREDKDDTMFGR